MFCGGEKGIAYAREEWARRRVEVGTRCEDTTGFADGLHGEEQRPIAYEYWAQPVVIKRKKRGAQRKKNLAAVTEDEVLH